MNADTAKELGRRAAEQLRAGNKPAVAELLRRAKRSPEPVQSQRVSNRPDGDTDILTPDGLMAWLEVSRGWIAEKRRPRNTHPLPALLIRPLRFSKKAVVAWLEEEGRRDTEHLQHKRALPVKHRPVKSRKTA